MNNAKLNSDLKTIILLTAFEGENNSSSVILNKVIGDNLVKVFLPNEFNESAELLLANIKEHTPKYIISMGRKPQIKRLFVEPSAHDHMNVITTTFDLDLICNSLKEYGIPFSYAKRQSSYLCNHIYYKGLNFIHNSGVKTRMIFIHTPDIKNLKNVDAVAQWLSIFCQQLTTQTECLND